MIPSLEGLPTKAKEAPTPHEVRLAPLELSAQVKHLRLHILRGDKLNDSQQYYC